MEEEKISSHKQRLPIRIIAWILCFVFIGTCSIAIVQGTKSVFQEKKDWTEYIDLSELNYANYAMYYRAMQAKDPGKNTVESCFFDEEVYTQDIFESLPWNATIEHYNRQLDCSDDLSYVVFDNSSKEIYTNAGQQGPLLMEYVDVIKNPQAVKNENWDRKMKQKFGYYSVIQYDEKGNPTILDCFGKNKEEILAATRPINQLKTYEVPIYQKLDSRIIDLIEADPASESFEMYGEEFIKNGVTIRENGDYFYNYSSYNSSDSFQELVYQAKGYVKPSNIKNTTMIVAIEEPLRVEPYQETYFYLDYSFNVIPDGFVIVYLILLVIISIAAITVACIKSLGIATSCLSKIPVEIVGIAATGVVLVAQPFAWLTRYHSRGLLLRNLENGNLSTGIAQLIDVMLIYGGWFLYFAVIFFGIISVLSIFRKGIKRYCLENSIMIRFLVWLCRLCKCWWKKIIGHITVIDYHEPVNKQAAKIVVINFLVIFVMCCIWFFGIPVLILYSILVFYYLRRYLNKLKSQYDQVLEATQHMAEGQLEYQLEEELGVFTPMATELNKVQDGFKRAVSEEVKSQKMKTELITNVSHDLKTPLTAIITYINLLKEEEMLNEQQREYVEVLDNKSMRLKRLIEDLFEVSKINSSNITLDPVDVDVVELIKQAQLELSDRFAEAGIDYRLSVPEEKVILHLDSQKTYRIFENLFVNVVKYAQPGTRAYMSVTVDDGLVTIVLKNISANELNISPEQLTERFVRGDESRNTEGSGLGLAIVKSIVEVQGGKFTLEVDGDLFKAIIQFHQS